VDGLGSGKDGHSWSYSTATTSVKEKTLAVARHVRGVRELDIRGVPHGTGPIPGGCGGARGP